MNPADLAFWQALIASSALWRRADGVATALTRASATSGVVGIVTRVKSSLQSAEPADRLQLIAVVVGTAATVHGLATLVAPASVVSALPRGLWLVVAVMSGVVALSARGLAAAWPTSRLRAAWTTARAFATRGDRGYNAKL